MPLSDTLRAAVYARDRAICSFSGLSLWILDHGTAPFWQGDWPDHVKPVSRGGTDAVHNLVSASHFYNGKKKNNGSDNQYLFRSGTPTEEFFLSHGVLTHEQAQLIRRHKNICLSDWYFNRALYNLSVAMQDEWCKFKAARTAEYWQKAAYRRLEAWRSKANASDKGFVARGLVRYPNAPDVQLMLSLQTASYADLQRIYRKLVRHYCANAYLMQAFSDAKDHASRDQLIRQSERKGVATQPVLDTLRINHRLLQTMRAASNMGNARL